jgi:molecular chaperone IbpA
LTAFFAQPNRAPPKLKERGQSVGDAGSYPCRFTEDVVMRAFDFTPYYRSTVGFDRLFDMLDQSVRSEWPPYNTEKKGKDQYRITMTVAGYAADEIELVQLGATLLITGQKSEQPALLHQSIPLSFKQSFNLADHMKRRRSECRTRFAHD